MQDRDRKDYLKRLVMGLEMAIEDTRARLPYYPPEDVELKYAKKFLAAMEDNLSKSRRELDELLREEAPSEK